MSTTQAKDTDVALIGANGMLATAVLANAPEGYQFQLFDLPVFDLTNRDQVIKVITDLNPAIIINCAAYTNVDVAEKECDIAMLVNGNAVGSLAIAAKRIDAVLVHVSTDYVFDGFKDGPYTEIDITNPQSAYGRSKLAGEQAIINSQLEKYFIVRTSWLYGPGGKNFVETILRLASEHDELRIIDDQIGSPTFTADLADAIFSLMNVSTGSKTNQNIYGVYHFSNEGQCSWYDFACEIVELARKHNLPVKTSNIVPISTKEYPLPAKRPANSVFDKTKYKVATGARVPFWQNSLNTYFSIR